MKTKGGETLSSRMVHKGLFEVTDSGEVYRMKGSHKELAKQIKTGKDGKYLCVTAFVSGKQKHFYVHRLVAEAFIPNPYNLPMVNHLDVYKRQAQGSSVMGTRSASRCSNIR